MTKTKKLIITALSIALTIVLPLAFHMVPNAGSIYCPMHIPVLLCGLICGGSFGFFCGVLGTVLSTLFTGMPPAPYMPSMVAELAVYGIASGLLIKFVHTKKTSLDLYISLFGAMLSGRIVSGILKAAVFSAGSYSVKMWLASYFITSFPALVIQLVLIPIIYLSLQKAKVIKKRY